MTSIYIMWFLLQFQPYIYQKVLEINFCIISLLFQSNCICSIRFQGFLFQINEAGLVYGV